MSPRAEELASYGYIVVGMNHPFDVSAVSLMEGSIAQFLSGPFAIEDHEAWVAERINERKADVLFTLKNLENLNDDQLFADHLDLSRIAVIGHSLGGITARILWRQSRDTILSKLRWHPEGRPVLHK